MYGIMSSILEEWELKYGVSDHMNLHVRTAEVQQIIPILASEATAIHCAHTHAGGVMSPAHDAVY